MLKTGLEEALEELQPLREEAKNTARAEDSKISGEPDDMWTFISDVREKYQLVLASAVADHVSIKTRRS